MTLGFIGLGRMGHGMAANLLAAGHSLTVFDKSPQAMAAVVDKGATGVASSAAVASACDLLFLCLPDEKDAEDVLFSESGVMAGAGSTLSIVDTSTMNYYSALDIAARVHAAGVAYSDCPISGMPFRAEAGTLTMMFGGSDEAFKVAKPFLDVMGEFIIHCGQVGMGQMMKAINNIIYNINIVALCEVMPLAVKAGLNAETVAAVVTSGSSRSFASDYFVPRILEGRFDSDFPMQAAYKDIVNVQEIATRLKAPIPVTNAMISVYQNAIASDLGGQPKSAMIKLYERALDLQVRLSPGSNRHTT